MIPHKKSYTAKSLAKIIQRLRARGKKIVFTNGCFDILHRGHVQYLQKAQRLGDVLIVALNTDASIKRLKGPSRPINPLSDRMEVMAALECVRFVTSFSGETPLQLIRLLKPDVLVKGGDWKPSSIVGAEDVKSWGGKVRSLRLLKGRSTTSVIERAQESR